jgi:hypothetical protein
MSREAVAAVLVVERQRIEKEVAVMDGQIAFHQAQLSQLQVQRDDAARKVASFDETIADIDAKSAAELPPIETESP